MNRLSHTAVTKFQTCAKAYEYHYVQKLREKVTSGALIFGSALDSALNILLLEPEKNPYEAFDKAFTTAKINGIEQYIPESELVVYSEKDFDWDLLSDDAIEKLNKVLSENDIKESLEDAISRSYKLKSTLGWAGMGKAYKKLYSLSNWYSMQTKGHLMIDCYKTDILPNIKEVLTVQKEIKLTTPEGDVITGFVDAVFRWKDNKIIIFDNKTAAREYDSNAVLMSPQLALYVHALKEEYNTEYAGFIVLNKTVIKNKKKVCSICNYKAIKGSRHEKCSNFVNEKRCNGTWNESIDPEIKVQILIDKIDEHTRNLVLNNFAEINYMIKQGVFTRNFNSCKTGYGLCAFYKKCWKNDESDLVKL